MTYIEHSLVYQNSLNLNESPCTDIEIRGAWFETTYHWRAWFFNQGQHPELTAESSLGSGCPEFLITCAAILARRCSKVL